MAPSITAVMQGVETRLKTISGLRTSPFVPEQVNPPQAMVEVPTIDPYHAAFAHGKFVLEIVVVVLTSQAYDRTGIPALASYADPTGSNSIHAAIEGDRTLGGAVDDCIVLSFRPADHTVGAIPYYGGEFLLKVIASGV